MFVIMRSDGKYVAPPGREKSYTDRLQEAWGFTTREAAEAHRCIDNESIVAVDELIPTR
jgi:hypothetical protein